MYKLNVLRIHLEEVLKMARNETIHVAVREDIKQDLKKIADDYGLTMSALASFIIGQWVYSQKTFVNPTLFEMKELAKEKFCEEVRLVREANEEA